jgi:tRNA pseudouridine38-40 synthase
MGGTGSGVGPALASSRPMFDKRLQLLVRFGYAGELFHGVQPQPGVATAGEALHRRLVEAFGAPPKALNFTARTDAGVHATTNIATCWFRAPIDLAGGLRELVAPRADGLFGVEAERVAVNVHARTLGLTKHYLYLLEDGCPEGAHDNLFVWQVTPRLEAERMRRASMALVGTHDFTSFRAPRCSAGTPVKTLLRIGVSGPLPGATPERHRFAIDIVGDAFLRKMVRIIVGTLAEIGAGLREPDAMAQILAAKERGLAGVGAPARGLRLVGLVAP